MHGGMTRHGFDCLLGTWVRHHPAGANGASMTPSSHTHSAGPPAMALVLPACSSWSTTCGRSLRQVQPHTAHTAEHAVCMLIMPDGFCYLDRINPRTVFHPDRGWTQPGTMMAAADTFHLTVAGRGGHGAMPHLSVDPVVAAAAVIVALQPLVSRETSPTDGAVVTVATINTGALLRTPS